MTRFPRLRHRVGRCLRQLSEIIDRENTPGTINWSFTFERGRGIVFHEGRQNGCPLAYLTDADYELAHKLSGRIPPPEPPRPRDDPGRWGFPLAA